MNENSKNNNLIGIIVVLGVLVVGLVFYLKQNPNPKSSNKNLIINNSSKGNYDTEVSYRVPSGEENIKVSITIDKDVISDIKVNLSKTDKQSLEYQTGFENSYKSLVLGKNIKEVNLSRVGGASLTTNAFMEAIKSISQKL
jgi:uncharacterized protein with FMN-binding domain